MTALNALVLKHFDHPTNAGVLPVQDQCISLIKAGSAAQGEWVHLYCDIQNNTINNIKFKAYGNPYIIAGASYLTEKLLHQTVSEIKINYQSLIKLFEMPKTYYHSAIVLDDALNQLKQRESNYEFNS